MAPHTESYEHLGEVKAWVQDMHPVWEQKREATRITIPPERITLQLETEINVTAELVWDYLSRPEFLQTLLGASRKVSAIQAGGRIAPGSVYHCYHGDKLLTVTVLEWQPFERMLFNSLVPIPIPNTYALMELRLTPTGTGTRLTHA
jgi:uncharacterized protein YndB with AHSA1/START domain